MNWTALRNFIKSGTGFIINFDLGPYPWKRLIFLIFNVALTGGSLINIILYLITVACVVFLIEYFQALSSIIETDYTLAACTVAWLCVQYSSLMCIYLLCHVMILNYETIGYIWQTQFRDQNSRAKHLRTLIGGLELCCAVFLLLSMFVWYSEVREAGVVFPFILLYWAMLIFKLPQFLVGSVFFILVCPVQNAWMTYTANRTKELVVQLAMWQCYNALMTLILTFLLRRSNENYALIHLSLIYILFYFYITFRLFWLTMLSLQIANTSLFPLTYHPEVDSKRLEDNYEGVVGWTIDSQSEVVVGLESSSRESIAVPQSSVIVCGTIGDRFEDVIKPLESNKKKKEEEKPSRIPSSTPEADDPQGTLRQRLVPPPA